MKIWYNATMQKHWSVDEKELAKDPRAYAIWRLEQRINFGIGEQFLDADELRAYWNEIDIDPAKRQALSFALET